MRVPWFPPAVPSLRNRTVSSEVWLAGTVGLTTANLYSKRAPHFIQEPKYLQQIRASFHPGTYIKTSTATSIILKPI